MRYLHYSLQRFSTLSLQTNFPGKVSPGLIHFDAIRAGITCGVTNTRISVLSNVFAE